MNLSKETLKNLFDALKTISLAITGVSIALLSNVVLSPHRDIVKAQSDLLQLLRLQQELKDMSTEQITNQAVIVSARMRLQSLNLSIPSLRKTAPPANASLLIPGILNRPTGLQYETKVPDTSQKIGSLVTLSTFQPFWDELCKTLPVWDVSDKIDAVYLTREGKKLDDPACKIASYTLTPHKENQLEVRTMEPAIIMQSNGKPEARFNFDLTQRGGASQSAYGYAWISWWMDEMKKAGDTLDLEQCRLTLECGVQSRDVIPIEWLTTHHLPTNAPSKTFAQVFPGLAALPPGYQTIQLTDLKSKLGEDFERSKGDLEVFGVKIPNEVVAGFGIPILIVLLFQFWSVCSYTANLTKTIPIEDASQWSFLLNGIRFSVMGIGVTLILPIGATICNVLFIPSTYFPPSVGWISALLVISFSVLATASLIRLRKYVGVESDLSPSEKKYGHIPITADPAEE